MLRAAMFTVRLVTAANVTAVERSSDGYGQVLLYPYFSAQEALSTVASITRTVGAGDGAFEPALAVSVVVNVDTGDNLGTLSAEHFTVLLAPNASWNFAISRIEGRTALTTVSPACAFRGNTPLSAGPAFFATEGGEGWVEVYALGRANDPEVARLLGEGRCSDIAARVAALPAAAWLQAAGNELRGAAHLVDVPSGTSYSLPTTALKDFAQSPLRGGFDDQPTLADAAPPIATVATEDGQSIVSTFSQHPVDAVSAVLMDAQWEVDFTVEPALAARTDLVITAPTRHWYVDGESTQAPFASDPQFAPGGAVATSGRLHDRNGHLTTRMSSTKCTPAPPFVPQRGPQIGRSITVIQFAQQPALPSQRSYGMPHRGASPATCFTNEAPVWQRMSAGRLSLRFDTRPANGVGRLVSDEGDVFLGLPLIGAGVTKAVNGNINGSLANFGIVQWISRTPGYPLE